MHVRTTGIVLVGWLVAAGCGKSKDAPAADSTSPPSATAAASASTEAAATAAPSASAPSSSPTSATEAGGESTGIPACDAYIAKLEQCGMVPAESIAQMRAGYRMAKSSAAALPQVVAACTQAASALTCPATGGSPPAPAVASPAEPVGAHAAIASAEGTTLFGLAINQPTPAAARTAALARCGHPSCQVGEVIPEGQCVIVSTIEMGTKVGVAWGNKPTIEGALEELSRVCQENGLTCPVVAWGCSDGGPPQVVGGGKEFVAPPPVTAFKPPPRPARRQCSGDGDCPGGTHCVIRRCPNCSTCEAGAAAPKDCFETGCPAGLTCCDVGTAPECTDVCGH